MQTESCSKAGSTFYKSIQRVTNIRGFNLISKESITTKYISVGNMQKLYSSVSQSNISFTKNHLVELSKRFLNKIVSKIFRSFQKKILKKL